MCDNTTDITPGLPVAVCQSLVPPPEAFWVAVPADRETTTQRCLSVCVSELLLLHGKWFPGGGPRPPPWVGWRASGTWGPGLRAVGRNPTPRWREPDGDRPKGGGAPQSTPATPTTLTLDERPPHLRWWGTGPGGKGPGWVGGGAETHGAAAGPRPSFLPRAFARNVDLGPGTTSPADLSMPGRVLGPAEIGRGPMGQDSPRKWSGLG